MLDERRTLRILVADTDSALRASIAFSLTHAGHEVDMVSESTSVLSVVKRESIDLLLLDWQIGTPGLGAPGIGTPGIGAPGIVAPSALELCRTIRRSSSMPIMILAVRDSEDDLVSSFDAGADDFLRKPFSPRTLVARVHALARRAQRTMVTTINVGSLHLDLEQHVLRIGETATVHLTPLELKALQLLVAIPGRTVASERLLTHLWGRQSDRERHTLKQLIYRLRGKLSEVGAAAILKTTPGSGYKLSVD
jgi:DNA-binding response OmpR family regulator